jgi:hypothetical protein
MRGQAAPSIPLPQATRKVLDELHAYDDLIERCKALGDRDLHSAAVNRKCLNAFRNALRFGMFRTVPCGHPLSTKERLSVDVLADIIRHPPRFNSEVALNMHATLHPRAAMPCKYVGGGGYL